MTATPELPIVICSHCGEWKYRTKSNVGSKCFRGGKNYISERLKKDGFQPFHESWGCQGTFEIPQQETA